MKVFIVISVFAFIAAVSADFVPKKPEDLQKYRDQCDGNVPVELREKYKLFEYPDDEVTHKHVRCVSEIHEIWDEKTGFKPELMLLQFGANKKDIVEKCVTKRNPEWTVDKWAWSDWKCLVANGIIAKP